MEEVRLAFDTTGDGATLVKRCATAEGIRSFWTDGVEGDAGEGERFNLTFPGAPPYVLETVEVGADSVSWTCVEGPESWVGTTMSFVMAGPHPMGLEGSLVLFVHKGWTSGQEGLPYIAYIWSLILTRLKASMETGSNNPFFVN